MGQRSSKNKHISDDVAPVVSNKDFSYEKHSSPLPKVELPSVLVTAAEGPGTINGQVKAITETNDINDEQDPRVPQWVNKENFKKLFMKLHPTFKEIISFKACPAMAAGENFATLVLRVKITAKFEDDTFKDFSFMLKIPHVTNEAKEMMKILNVFIIENTVYTEVIPELEDIYRQAGVEVSFGAKSYKLDLDDPNIYYVLMDDLSLDGFKNANRLECLNMEHALCVLRKMAQFHAASACRVATKGPYGPIFSPDMDNEIARGMISQMFLAFKKPFLENLKNFKDAEKYRDSVDKFFDNLIELFIRSRKLLPCYFSVLNHGDSWSNNILFKYSTDGNVKEAAYVDFQNTNWSSPAMDLYYFIISSLQIDIKLSQFDYFVRYYHENLTNNLKLLHYPLEIPSLREFHMQMMDFGSMATMASFLSLGIVLLDPTENAKFENFLGDNKESNEFRNAIYTNERYIKQINEILPWLYNRGFMEINLTEIDKRIAAADKLQESLTTIAAPEQNNEPSTESYPEWVNEALFIDVVRTDYENYQKILKFAICPATNAGDNYSSIMLKIDIDIELTDNSTRSLSYMLKIPPESGYAMALVSMLKAFEKETLAYYDIIPQFEKIYKEHAGVDIVFAPKSYKLNEDSGCNPLVLENLKIKGFQNGDRLEGLDMEHTKAVLKKLSEFHAASACVFESKGKYNELFEHTLYAPEVRMAIEFMIEPFLNLFQQCIQQYDNADQYMDKVKKFLSVYYDALVSANNNIDWNKFNVLNHGDCWTNNIMFQHDDEGHIKNTYFVDFQLCKYGSPVYDLYYFLLSSPKLELKLVYFDYFIRFYHENLKANLELLKYPKEIPSLEEIHMELNTNGVFALQTVTGVMAAVLLDPSDNANIDNMISNDSDGLAFKQEMFLNNRFRSHARAIFPWLCSRGLLDVKENVD